MKKNSDYFFTGCTKEVNARLAKRPLKTNVALSVDKLNIELVP